MNDWDRNNLEFILSLTTEQFDKWYSSISQDDVDYAIEIMSRARLETNERISEIFGEGDDLALARSVLANFTLKGNVK